METVLHAATKTFHSRLPSLPAFPCFAFRAALLVNVLPPSGNSHKAQPSWLSKPWAAPPDVNWMLAGSPGRNASWRRRSSPARLDPSPAHSSSYLRASWGRARPPFSRACTSCQQHTRTPQVANKHRCHMPKVLAALVIHETGREHKRQVFTALPRTIRGSPLAPRAPGQCGAAAAASGACMHGSTNNRGLRRLIIRGRGDDAFVHPAQCQARRPQPSRYNRAPSPSPLRLSPSPCRMLSSRSTRDVPRSSGASTRVVTPTLLIA